MKIGYNEATAMGCSTLEQDLELCEMCGFDFIEIRLDMLKDYLTRHKADELVAFFAKSHLKPHFFNAIYTYPQLFSINDNSKQRDCLLSDFMLGCIIGEKIGASGFVVVPPMGSGAYNEPFEGDEATIFLNCERILRKLSKIALKYNMKIGLEPIGAAKSGVRTIDLANRIINAVDLENVGLVFDPCNLYMYNKLNDFSEMIKTNSSKLFAVHINDYDDVSESELCPAVRCFCGYGVINLNNFLSVLKKMEYHGIVSIETFRPSHWLLPAAKVISDSYNTTALCLAENGCL